MAYMIQYQPEDDSRYPPVKRKADRRHIAMWMIGVVTVLICFLFGGEILDFLIPGDPEITKAAVAGIVEDLRNGMPITDVIDSFCGEILNEAI